MPRISLINDVHLYTENHKYQKHRKPQYVCIGKFGITKMVVLSKSNEFNAMNIVEKAQ